ERNEEALTRFFSGKACTSNCEASFLTKDGRAAATQALPLARRITSHRLSRASRDGCSTETDVLPSIARCLGFGFLAGFASSPHQRSCTHRGTQAPSPLLHTPPLYSLGQTLL